MGRPVFRARPEAGEAGFRTVEQLPHRLGRGLHLLFVHRAGQQLVDHGHDGIDVEARHEKSRLATEGACVMRHSEASSMGCSGKVQKQSKDFYRFRL